MAYLKMKTKNREHVIMEVGVTYSVRVENKKNDLAETT